jgi:hypothetical protein
METWFDYDALTLGGGRVVFSAIGTMRTSGHDIPHPIGDPDDDEGLPGDDDEEEDNDDEDDDEEPMQV